MGGEVYRLDGLAVPEQLDRLHRLIAEAAAEHPEVPATDLMALETAALEVANNVVEHARPPGGVTWTFEVRVSTAALSAVLSDSGEAGDTPWLAGADGQGSSGEGTLDVPDMPDELAETGRGLPLAAALVDDLRFRREDGRNVWTMQRRLTG